MPYITQETRQFYTAIVERIKNSTIVTKGDLEYLIFTLMQQYMKDKEQRYSTLHDCTYAAMHCADEFRRRFLDKREDTARETNGDI